MKFALLHGGGQGSWVWAETRAALEALGASVLLLDVPGCGTKRGRNALELTLEQVADELLSDMAKAGFQGAALVGHSQAGTLMPVMWARNSGEIGSLCYLSACAPLPGQSVIELMGDGMHGEQPDQVGWPLDPKTHARLDVRRIAFCNDMDEETANAFMMRPVRDEWPPLVTFAAHWNYDGLSGAPSFYMLCQQDNILPPKWQRCFAERLHCQRIVEIDAGHQAMTTQPEKLAAMLLAESQS